MKKKRNGRTPESNSDPAAKKRITLGEKWAVDSEQLSEARSAVPWRHDGVEGVPAGGWGGWKAVEGCECIGCQHARPVVRRVLEVRETSVRFCNWDGEHPHHAHAISYLAPGAIVAVGDNVPLSALGGYVAHHWYRRVGDECLIAHGDGTLCDGEHSAAKE